MVATINNWYLYSLFKVDKENVSIVKRGRVELIDERNKVRLQNNSFELQARPARRRLTVVRMGVASPKPGVGSSWKSSTLLVLNERIIRKIAEYPSYMSAFFDIF